MAPPDARAVTLYAHQAHAVAHLGKPIENRTRPIPPALVGQRVAIHAGAEVPREVADEVLIRCNREGGMRWERDLRAFADVSTSDERWSFHGRKHELGHVLGWDDALRAPLSRMHLLWPAELRDAGCYVDGRPVATRAIVATAVLRPHDPLSVLSPNEPPPWALRGYYWWALHDVITLAQPVPVRRGQLGLWRLDAATVEAVGAAGGWG